jgi:hypothetical protein
MGAVKSRTRPKQRSAEDATVTWLLEGDPAIRWQTLRDLAGAPVAAVERERRRVAREGWGARLLAQQDRAGSWAAAGSSDGGLYVPKWTSTTYTMLLLRDFGLPSSHPSMGRACRLLLDRGLQPDGGIHYGKWGKWTGRGETCVTGMVLSLLSYFDYDDERVDVVADHLLGEQMDDGGWNCRRHRGDTHSSVNTTILALEGLRLYELHRRRKVKAVREAQRGGREFLLEHRLFRSHRTGEVIKPAFTKFAFPPRWHYDVLRALDYFQDVDAPRDPRLADAIALVHRARDQDGRWPLQNVYAGKTWFPIETKGRPSRWNTLRALRVLRWWAPAGVVDTTPSGALDFGAQDGAGQGRSEVRGTRTITLPKRASRDRV